MYTVANLNECNSVLTSATRGETLTLDPNEWNSTLTSDTRGGGQLPNPKECNSILMSAMREETLTPNPNECNSSLTSGTSVRKNLQRKMTEDYYWREVQENIGMFSKP